MFCIVIYGFSIDTVAIYMVTIATCIVFIAIYMVTIATCIVFIAIYMVTIVICIVMVTMTTCMITTTYSHIHYLLDMVYLYAAIGDQKRRSWKGQQD